MYIQDLLDDEDFLQSSNSPIEPRKQKTSDFMSRFSDNWMTSGQRIVDNHKWLADTYNSNQSIKDKALRTWNAWSADVMSAMDMIFGSPIAWALWADGTEDPNTKPNWFLKWMSDWVEWAWDRYTEWFDSMLDTKLSEKEKETTKFVGWEWLAEWVWFWVGKIISKSAWWIGSIWKEWIKIAGKKFWDMRFSRVDLEESISKYNAQLDMQLDNFSKIEVNPELTTNKMNELLEKVWSWNTSISEIKKISSDIGVDDEYFIKSLEDVANNKYYKSNAISSSILKLSKWLSEKTFNKTRTALLDAWFWKSSKLSKVAIKSLKDSGVSQSQIDKTIDAMNSQKEIWKWDNAMRIESFLEQSKIKADAKAVDDYSMYDDNINQRRWELLKYMEDNNLVKKEVITWKNNQEYFSFSYTEKWLSELDKVDYQKFSGTYRWDLKQNHINNWIAHYPVKKYNNVSNKIDEWKTISYAEINDSINDLARDVDFDKIDTYKFNKELWEKVNTEEFIFHVENINNKYWLKLSESIEKVKRWDESLIKEIIEEIEALKRNEYITVDRLANPWKTIRMNSEIWTTNRMFKTLFAWVETLSKWDLNKRLWQIKWKMHATRKAIIKKWSNDKITAKTKIKNLDKQYKAEILEIKARYAWITAVKQELKKNILEIWKNSKFKWDINKVIKKAVAPKNWDNITKPEQLKKKIEQINKEIEAEHARWLIREIKDELRTAKISKTNKWAKAQRMSVEQVLQIDQAKKMFWRIRFWDLNVKDLDELLKEIKEVKDKWASTLLKKQRDYTIKAQNEIKEIEKDIVDMQGTKNIENETVWAKLKWLASSWQNVTYFSPRLISKLFWKSKLAYERFITDVSRAFNAFETFEIKYTDKLAENIWLLFKKNVDEIEEFWQYLYARRRIYDWDEISWIWLDRIMHDKTSAFFKKTDEFIDMPKPKEFSELSDDIWDEISKTELAWILSKWTDSKFIEATKLWDKYHRLTGKMINKTRMEVDNQFIEPDDFYISFQAKRWPNSEVVPDLWQADFNSKYISPKALKWVSKEIKRWDFVWDYNPISSLYGNGRNARYYSFMQETHKNMISLYDWVSKRLKDFDVDELNEVMENQDKYSFTHNWNKVEPLESVAKDWDSLIEVEKTYKIEDWEWGFKEVIKIEHIKSDELRAKSTWSWLWDKLTDEWKYRLKKYIERVWKNWSTFDWQSERALAMMANHFNRLPLMGSMSVILKQPLSLIDAQGMIWPKNLFDAEVDLLKWEGVSNALDSVPSIHNRWGWDFLIKELKNHTPWSDWYGKLTKKYWDYVDVAMAPIKYADQWTYKKIWLWAYREALINKEVITSNQRVTADMLKNIDDEAMNYADDIANKSASTANPLMMPQVYDKAWSKALFWIFTTQLNRLQIMFKDVPDLWKDWRRAQALYLSASLMASNVAEYAVTIWVGKFMYSIWASTWEWYDEDFLELMATKDLLHRITWEQTFLWSKYTWINTPQFWVAPMLWGITKIGGDVEDIINSPSFETITKLPIDLFWGKIVEQTSKVIKNN